MSEKRNNHAHAMCEEQQTAAWSAFNEALHLVYKGNISEFARSIEMTPQAVHRWYDRRMIPAHRVLDIVDALDGFVTEYDLRPDVFRKVAA
jgi:DNA-binding transcriptional regulator YdaS (Cro superfamily)